MKHFQSRHLENQYFCPLWTGVRFRQVRIVRLYPVNWYFRAKSPVSFRQVFVLNRFNCSRLLMRVDLFALLPWQKYLSIHFWNLLIWLFYLITCERGQLFKGLISIKSKINSAHANHFSNFHMTGSKNIFLFSLKKSRA